jgi:chromosome segregation ATPase
MQRFRHG